MPSYLDEDIEKKLFTILHKKYPERCGEISETNQWEAKVEGMRGVSVGEGVMVFARGGRPCDRSWGRLCHDFC